MIAHKGENIIVGSHFVGVDGAFSLAEYTVRCLVTDIVGREVYNLENSDVVRGEDNCVACVIPARQTRLMKSGTYFLSFELWLKGEKVLSNEVEQVDII